MEYKLEDIVEINIGRTPSRRNKKYWGSGSKWVSIRDLNFLQEKKYIINTKESITSLAIKESKIKQTPANTVLYSFKLSIGKIAITKDPIYTNEAIASFRIKDTSQLSTEYLFYALKKVDYQSKTDDAVMGKTLNKRKLALLTIPVPDLPTQNKIVVLLDKASALVQKREKSIAQLDELLRAQFLEMFGDPVLNPKDWESISFSKIGKFQSGGTPSKKNDEFWQGNFPWVSPKDMKRELINDSIDHISKTVFEKTSLKKIPIHNILIVVRGMILAHSFPVAINISPISINQDMKAIQLNNNFNPFYTLTCLIVMKKWILKFVSTAGHGTKKMSSESIDSLKILSPPIKLQNEFETIYHHIQSQKETLIQSKKELENLYNSLLQDAFIGKLV